MATRMVITKDQVMPLLLEACPSFHSIWGEHQREGESEMLYVACGAFAAHLLGLQRRQQTDEFPHVAQLIRPGGFIFPTR